MTGQLEGWVGEGVGMLMCERRGSSAHVCYPQQALSRGCSSFPPFPIPSPCSLSLCNPYSSSSLIFPFLRTISLPQYSFPQLSVSPSIPPFLSTSSSKFSLFPSSISFPSFLSFLSIAFSVYYFSLPITNPFNTLNRYLFGNLVRGNQ